jgi:hypothetical protein
VNERAAHALREKSDNARRYSPLDFLRGTLPPARRASERPIAIACFRLVTFLPDRPLFNVPLLRSRIALLTFSCAFFPYLAMVAPFYFFNALPHALWGHKQEAVQAAYAIVVPIALVELDWTRKVSIHREAPLY